MWKKIKPRTRVEWFFATLSVALVVGFGIFCYLWFWHDNPPLVVYNEPLPVVNELPVYEPGDTIVFRVDACRVSTGTIRYTRYWVDTLQYSEPQYELPGGDDECFSRGLIATVPPLPTGRYYVEYHVAYRPNILPVWRLVTFATDEFDVVGVD